MNLTDMNIHVQAFLRPWGGGNEHLDMELLCHLISVCYLYRKLPYCLAGDCTILHSRQKCMSSSSTASPSLGMANLSLILGFNLHFPD